MSHTPGPWSVNGDHKILVGADDGKMMLAEALHSHIMQKWCRPLATAQANARLIAAAPDLLDALENLSLESTGYLQDLSSNHVDATTLVGAIRKAKAAIKKAREG